MNSLMTGKPDLYITCLSNFFLISKFCVKNTFYTVVYTNNILCSSTK